MSNRLDKEKEAKFEPKRFNFAVGVLESMGYELTLMAPKRIDFIHKGEKVILYPYSGWYSGKSVKHGRGIQNLLNQLK